MCSIALKPPLLGRKGFRRRPGAAVRVFQTNASQSLKLMGRSTLAKKKQLYAHTRIPYPRDVLIGTDPGKSVLSRV